VTREQLRAWVAATRARQGLSPTISDAATLATLAAMVADALLRPGGARAGPDPPSRRAARKPPEAPELPSHKEPGE
jgi:hypothetical protein